MGLVGDSGFKETTKTAWCQRRKSPLFYTYAEIRPVGKSRKHNNLGEEFPQQYPFIHSLPCLLTRKPGIRHPEITRFDSFPVPLFIIYRQAASTSDKIIKIMSYLCFEEKNLGL